ncbi:hypothetical protein SAMN05444161_3477 [Rhizobiales bacterium GAS191]|jgi:hypothetical protein|nr:hypothetical protein SAMN05519103_02644 [Rhizobiales bacterium GAS113]SED56227.1 hypothetical protein SAMN05444161_3477 [Rhizobiales bacterium GAS191]SEE79212.1 hypothetical protein SAMN05519104_7503 [Rhizobiales bacterium GAS188]
MKPRLCKETCMRKHLLLAAAMGATLALSVGGAGAATFSPQAGVAGQSEVTPVAGGCGWGFHPGPYGGCRRNGAGWGRPGPGFYGPGYAPGPRAVVGPYGGAIVCPPGYHLGPNLRACWPN